MTRPLPGRFGCVFMSSLTARAFGSRHRSDRFILRRSLTGGRPWTRRPCRATVIARQQTVAHCLVPARDLPQSGGTGFAYFGRPVVPGLPTPRNRPNEACGVRLGPQRGSMSSRALPSHPSKSQQPAPKLMPVTWPHCATVALLRKLRLPMLRGIPTGWPDSPSRADTEVLGDRVVGAKGEQRDDQLQVRADVCTGDPLQPPPSARKDRWVMVWVPSPCGVGTS